MITASVVFGVVALFSIGINIFQRVCMQNAIETEMSLRSKVGLLEKNVADWKQTSGEWRKMSEKWKSECHKADENLTEANAKLAKYDRKRDPITGKIVKG